MRHKQLKKEGLLASYFPLLETRVKRVVIRENFVCAMLWRKNLVLTVSRI